MINEVRLIGNVGQDPRINKNSKGTMATFSVATTEKWKDKRTGDWQEKTEWHKCVAFGYPADYVDQYLEKGALVYVEGSMQYGKYERDGVEISTAEVKAQKIKILKKQGDRDNQTRDENRSTDNGYMGSTGSDVPF